MCIDACSDAIKRQNSLVSVKFTIFGENGVCVFGYFDQHATSTIRQQ